MNLRVAEVSPGIISTDFIEAIADEPTKQIADRVTGIAIPPEAIARGIVEARGRPSDMDVGGIVIRPAARG